MKNKLIFGFLIIFLLIFVSGCIGSKTEATCGNERLDSGEECDGGGCSPGQECENCKCVTSSSGEITSPPPLPA